MLKRKKIIATLLATAIIVPTMGGMASAASVSHSTIAGNDRYQTAVEISKNGWSSATNAVLINGDKGLVDALTATPFASLKNAPILVTGKDTINSDTLKRLKDMGVKNVFIVGGTAVVSDNVANQLKSNNMTVNRISGSDRYTTAVAVADEINKIQRVSKVAVVNGATGLPDAVSIAAPAAENNMPILLSDPNKGIAEAQKFMNGKSISKSYVVGSTGAVSSSIQNSLPGSKTRLGGSDRHATNVEVINEFYGSRYLDNVYVAKSGYVKNNEELVDALSVGVLAAKNDDPVLIVGKNLDSKQASMLANKDFSRITTIGNVPSQSITDIKNTQADEESKVTGVTVVDYKTIKLSGTGLDKLSSGNVSMSGNSVSSYTANGSTSATVVFNNAFGTTNTVRITSNLGNVSSHSFNYSSEISTVEAVTSLVGDTGVQYVELTVNGGQKRTVEELKALGWKVEFKSSSNIFYNGTTNGTTTSETGKLKQGLAKGDYTYEVNLTKSGKTIKSGLKAFSVVDNINQCKEIKSYELFLADVKLSSSKLVVDEKVTVSNVKGLDKNNNEIRVDNYTLKSSSPAVASISGNQIIANSTGRTTITITSGNVSKTFEINVVSDARKVNSVSLSSSSVKVVGGNSATVEATIKDQYGDPVKDKTLNVVDESKNIAFGKIYSSTKEGKATVDITGGNKGSSRIYLRESGSDKNLATITANVVENAGVVKSYSLQINETGKDTTLNVYKEEKDMSVEFKLNKLDSSGYLIGTEKDITVRTSDDDNSTNETIWVKSTKSEIANVSVSSGILEVKALKAGSTTIEVYKDRSRVAYVNITVKDSTPKITDITIYNTADIEKAKIFDVESLLNTTNTGKESPLVDDIKVSGTKGDIYLGSKEINGKTTPMLFIDGTVRKSSVKDGTPTVGKYDEDYDTVIATIDLTTDFKSVNEDNKTVVLGAGDKGNIIVKMYHGERKSGDNPFKTIVIGVNIK